MAFVFMSSVTFAACNFPGQNSQTTQNQATPTPAAVTTQQIRQLIDTGATQREAGDYQTGEQKLSQAFEGAIALKDSALTVEAGNNLSIQYRLSAGRANRAGKTDVVLAYSQKSLDIYQKLRDLGLFSATNPNIQRNWSHALLYAGKVNQAIPELQLSKKLQKDLSAQGDEWDHLAMANIALGQIAIAQNFNTQGLSMIQKNNGSKVWLTFGMMTRATILAKLHRGAEAKAELNAALDVATKNNLGVRKEEITYMLSQPIENVNVFQTVATPQATSK